MPDNDFEQFRHQVADLNTHRIEGVLNHGGQYFSVPIVSHVQGNLWQGGNPRPEVPAFFTSVLNLYGWEPYQSARTTKVRTFELLDSLNGVPSIGTMLELASWVIRRMEKGPVLVHCQAGINRSGLVSAFTLMQLGMSSNDAIALLRAKRSPLVLSNGSFEAWLRKQDA